MTHAKDATISYLLAACIYGLTYGRDGEKRVGAGEGAERSDHFASSWRRSRLDRKTRVLTCRQPAVSVQVPQTVQQMRADCRRVRMPTVVGSGAQQGMQGGKRYEGRGATSGEGRMGRRKALGTGLGTVRTSLGLGESLKGP
jgi:hypothetical protein